MRVRDAAHAGNGAAGGNVPINLERRFARRRQPGTEDGADTRAEMLEIGAIVRDGRAAASTASAGPYQIESPSIIVMVGLDPAISGSVPSSAGQARG